MVLAGKALQNASKPLTGDIYVRRWTSVKGKGKKRKEVEHEVHVNPLSIVVAGAVGAGAAFTAAAGLWLTQQKVGKKVDGDGNPIAKSKVRYCRLYSGVYEWYDEVIVDSPARDEVVTSWIHGTPKQRLVHFAAVTHTEGRQRTIRAPRAVVYTDRFLPIKTQLGVEGVEAVEWFSEHEAAKGWTFSGGVSLNKTGTDRLGEYSEYKQVLKNDSKAIYGLSERKGFSGGSLF